jgi:hypothetical protein
LKGKNDGKEKNSIVTQYMAFRGRCNNGYYGLVDNSGKAGTGQRTQHPRKVGAYAQMYNGGYEQMYGRLYEKMSG